MGSARDSSSGASQACDAARLSLPARVWLRPLSSSEPHFFSGSRDDSPRSRDTIPASAPPSMASPPLGTPKHATYYTFRHCFATHLLEAGCDIRTIQELATRLDYDWERAGAPQATAMFARRGLIGPFWSLG